MMKRPARLMPWLVASVLGGSLVSAGDDPAATCDQGDAKRVEFFVKTLDTTDPFLVNVPTAYLDRWFQPAPGSVQDSLLLDVDTRGFAPWSSDDQEYHMGILVTEYIDLTDIAQSRAKLQSGASLASEVTYPAQPAEYGLLRLDFDRGQTGFVAADIFVAAQDASTDDPGGITDVIICTAEGATPVSGCQHYIDVPLADMKLTYRRSHLGDWAMLSAQARAFWDCATTF